MADSFERDRARIGATLRELRRGRRWSQAELGLRLGVSQGRLSEIERGAGSLSAEQLLLVLKLFNVGASHFVASAHVDLDAELQNVLARLGAAHVQESVDVLPRERLEEVHAAIAAGLASSSTRLVTALAPVVVRQIDAINFRKLRADLRTTGLGRRLGWLLENVRDALDAELGGALTPTWSKRYRRASVVLGAELESLLEDDGTPGVAGSSADILDATIRSKQTLHQVRERSSEASRRWAIVTDLQAEDFAAALRGAREAG